MKGNAPTPPKNIAWNGLQFAVPQAWEAVVTAKRQLLFEDDLEPVLELKWHQKHALSLEQAHDKIIKQFHREFGHPDTINQFPKHTTRYQILQFTWQENKFSIFLLFCPVCHTCILVRPYTATDIQQVSESLQCHNMAESTKWAIQDFSFTLPNSCLLDSYSFSMGFTRISFKGRNSCIHLCRMIPAATHLQNESLENLLIKLTGCSSPSFQLNHCEEYIELQNFPSIISQLQIRMKRKKPFVYGRLWHHKASNKLMGFTIEDIKPPSQSTIEQIYNSHEATIC